MTSLTQFSLFPRLPLELRLKIWGHGLMQPRTFNISCKKNLIDVDIRVTQYFIYLTRPHALLQTCHESRTEAVTTYSYIPHFKTGNSDRCACINFDFDVIRCAASVLEYMGPEEVAGVKILVVELSDVAYFAHFHMETIRRMQSLEELVLLRDSEETPRWPGRGDPSVENLMSDFEIERQSNPAWRCPRVRMDIRESGEEIGVIEKVNYS